MKTAIANKAWFHDSDLRLDASYHLSETVQIKHLFKISPYKFTVLSQQASDIFSGNIFKRIYVKDRNRGLPYLTGSDIIKSDIDSGKYISKKQANSLQRLILKEGWILVTCSGTLGNVVYADKLFEGRIATHDLIRIIPNNKDVNNGFLYAYLASRYGFALLTHSSYGGVVKHIEPHHIKSLPIPIFPIEKQKQIQDLIIQSIELRVDANRLLIEAEELFERGNNLSYETQLLLRTENIYGNGASVKVSNKLVQTLKARHYSLRAQSIINKWNAVAGKPIHAWVTEEGLTRGMGGFFKRIDGTKMNGMDIISQSDIHDRRPSYKKVRKSYIKETELAKTGMIIMPAAGTLGENEVFLRPELVYLNFEGKVLSEVVGKLRSKSLAEAAYLFVALKSKPGFRILRTLVYGTNLLYPRWDLIKDINIPCKDEQLLKSVSNLVICAYEKRSVAKAKENQAIQLVEKEIDQWQN